MSIFFSYLTSLLSENYRFFGKISAKPRQVANINRPVAIYVSSGEYCRRRFGIISAKPCQIININLSVAVCVAVEEDINLLSFGGKLCSVCLYSDVIFACVKIFCRARAGCPCRAVGAEFMRRRGRYAALAARESEKRGCERGLCRFGNGYCLLIRCRSS